LTTLPSISLPAKQLIGGAWVGASTGGSWDVINPATEEVIRAVPFGGKQDAIEAIEAADAALPEWSAKTPYERGDILKRAATVMRTRLDELAHITVLESGKPFVEAKGEWKVASDFFEWFAEEGKRAYGRTIPSRVSSKRMFTLKQPVGVVGVITAWNFPAYNVARSWSAALAAGCTVVGRPAEYTPLTAMAMASILTEAGVSKGAINVINGDPEAMGQAMLDHPACRKISFTGSVRVGRILMDGASRTFTRLSLELGGNAPVLIFPDVDVDAVAKAAAGARYRNAGQVCVAPQRFLVHSKIHDEFTAKLVPHVGSLKVGSGLDPATRVGPLINVKQRERLEGLVDDAQKKGANVLAGGRRPPHLPAGYYYEPTVIGGVRPEMAISSEEIFGPILPVSAWEDIDEAVAHANSTPYGLAAYVWTNDLRAAVRAYEGLDFGMVGVNEWAPHATEAPFGGRKQSGIGREGGQEGLDEYLEVKLVSMGGI
jgi:succinate-semialdehyde dehydrogenase